jgi:hypothetical protein
MTDAPVCSLFVLLSLVYMCRSSASCSLCVSVCCLALLSGLYCTSLVQLTALSMASVLCLFLLVSLSLHSTHMSRSTWSLLVVYVPCVSLHLLARVLYVCVLRSSTSSFLVLQPLFSVSQPSSLLLVPCLLVYYALC